MADLDHNLSLADALTEPPHDVEEEVKRDFIATLEAEKFDDVVGETVDKTDYVPLLDDEDDAKAGSQEPKGSKGHVDGIPVEHSSASGPMVVENGDHGLQDHHTVFPGEIMDDKMSYKEFLDHNDSWPAEERELCFKAMDMADPFSIHRGENLPDLSFPTDMKNVPLFPGHTEAARDILAPHGSMMGPEQPFLGSLYSPAEALDPSAFIGLESGTEFLPGKAAPEEYWMGAQHDMKGPDTSFFVEPPVPPAATEAIRTSLPESPTAAAAPGDVPAAASALPGEAAASEGAKGSTPAHTASLPAQKEGPGDPRAAPGAAAAANPFQATPLGFSPAPEASPAKGVSDDSTPGTELGFTPAAAAGSHQGLDLGLASTPALDSQHDMDLGFAPAADTESHQNMDLGFAPAADVESHQNMDLGFAPAADVESHQNMGLGFAPAADTESHQNVDLGFAPAEDTESHQNMNLGFAPAADVESHQNMDLGFAPAADVESHQNVDLGFAPAEDAEPHHALDLGFAPAADNKAQLVLDSEFGPAAEVNHHPALDSEPGPALGAGEGALEAQPGPAAAPRVAVSPETSLQQDKCPAEAAAAEVEAESKVPEVCVDHSEKVKEQDRKPPPSPPDEKLAGKSSSHQEPAAEAKGALENKDLPEKSAPAENGETQKEEEAEHNHIQHTEPQEGKPLQEPPGLPTAQVRQAPKSRDRGFGRAKPAPVAVTDVPEEQPIGLPQQKSPEPRADPCSTLELGTSPRFRAPHKKVTNVPTEPVESCRDPPQENWDLEGAVVKKKKKKPKQRRSQVPRGLEMWDENGAASRNAPFGLGWQNPAPCPRTPTGSRAPDVPKDAKITTGTHILDEQNSFPVAAPGQQAPKSRVLDAREEMRAEGSRGDSWMLESKGKSKEVPSEVGKTKGEESATAKGPTKPPERDLPQKNEKREDKEAKGADLTVKAETSLQTKPSELPLSHKNKESKTPSPGQEGASESVHQPSLETAAMKNGEKSQGVEKESLKQPHLEDKIPTEPKAAGEGPAGTEGGPKMPRDAPGAPVLVPPKAGEVPAVQGRGAEGDPKHPSPGQAGARGVAADSPDADRGKGFAAPEQQCGKDPSWTHGMDRPKKKRSEGRGKRMKSCSEQLMLPEDAGRTEEAGKEGIYPENGQAVAARDHPSASPAPACPADKAKKRGSDGRSRKGERSFSQQPVPGDRMDAGSCAEVADEVQGGSDKGRQGGCVPAGALQENAAKMQRPVELGLQGEKENAGKGERGNLGALERALPLEKSREEAQGRAVAATMSPSEQGAVAGRDTGAVAGRDTGAVAGRDTGAVAGRDRGAVAGRDTGAAGSAGLGSAGPLLADKGRKRSSDGRRKEPERSPCGQAAGLAAGGDSGQGMGWEKEKGSGLQRERLAGEPQIQGGRGSCSGQPHLPGQETESSEPETGSAKETWPGKKGKEADKCQEHRAGVHSPTRELGMDKPKSKSRDGKGKKAEHSAELGPGDIPAVGHVQQTRSEKGSESSRAPAALLGHLPDPAKVQAPALPLEPGQSHTGGEEKHKNGEPDPQQPALLEHKAGAGMFPPPGLEIRDKPEAGGGRSKNPVPEHPAVSDASLAPVTERSKKRGYDGSSKKAKNASRPVPLEANPDRSEAQPPVGSGLDRGMEDTDFVDENRNIKNFPTGSQRVWNNEGSGFKSVSQTPTSGPGDGGDAPCGLPEQTEGGAGTGGLPPPPPPPPLEAVAEKSSREPGPGAEKEMQTQKCREQPLDLGHKAPGKEDSQKEGKSREAGSQRGHSKDKSHLSHVAEVDNKDIKPADKKHNTAKAPSELPQEAADPKPRAAEGTGGAEATVSCALRGTGSFSPAQAVPAAAMDSKAAGAEPQAAGVHGTAAQSTQKMPKESKKGPWQPAGESPAPAAQALLKDAPVTKSEVDKAENKTKEKDSQATDKERETQDTSKEKESQEVTKEKESQDTSKEKSQEVIKEKESQEATKEKKSQEIAKEKESQDTKKEKESQEATKAMESQDTEKEKKSQEVTKENESQDTSEGKKSQEITKEVQSQDTSEGKESQEITKENESQDTSEGKESQEITKEVQSQDTGKAKEPQAPPKETEEQKAVKEAKKERVKVAEQLKGYMRPTRARGVAAAVAPGRAAVAPGRALVAPGRAPVAPGRAPVARPRQDRGV